jgi:hypothetical protein
MGWAAKEPWRGSKAADADRVLALKGTQVLHQEVEEYADDAVAES